MSRTVKGSKGGGWELNAKRGYLPNSRWWQRYTHRVARRDAKAEIGREEATAE